MTVEMYAKLLILAERFGVDSSCGLLWAQDEVTDTYVSWCIEGKHYDGKSNYHVFDFPLELKNLSNEAALELTMLIDYCTELGCGCPAPGPENKNE